MSLRGGFSTHYNTFEPVMPMLKAKSDRTQKGSSDISYLRARPKYRSKSYLHTQIINSQQVPKGLKGVQGLNLRGLA